jgi:hypothetical protein
MRTFGGGLSFFRERYIVWGPYHQTTMNKAVQVSGGGAKRIKLAKWDEQQTVISIISIDPTSPFPIVAKSV